MNMTSIVKYVLVLCVLFVAGYTNAQITINTNFSVLSNQPIDSRDTLTTLADTSSVTWTFPGLLSYVVDIDEFWYYTGTQWRKLFDGTTIPSTVPDSLIVYAPAHGLSDTIALYGYVPVKADFTRANSTSIDSVFIAYAIDAPDTDSLTLIFSGVLTYGSWHGKELNTQYYLQDDGSDDTTPGTVSVPTAIASDSLTLFLREVGSDIAGQLRRVAMPSPLITAFGGNPASPTDAVVQAAIEGAYLPAGLAQPGTIFTLSYATQSYNPTYQQTAPNTNPLTPSYAWLWDGAYATRIVNIPTSVNLQDTSYGVLGTLVLLPIDSLMAASVPTDTEVALWLDTNYTANDLRLANGSLLYFIGDSTRQNPEYIWQVIDDISYDAGDTDWEKILKRIKFPTPYLNTLPDVDTANISNGDFLMWDSIAGNWIPQEIPPDYLNNLPDVDTANIDIDDILQWDGSNWIMTSPVELIGDGGGAYGSGLAGRTAYWLDDSTLVHTEITYSSTILDASALTGALRLPSGTDAQDPVWSAGMLRYNTTANGIQGYDGTAERYLPWADADNWAANRIPYSDGSKLTTTSKLEYSSGILQLDNGTGLVINFDGSTNASVRIGTRNGTLLLPDAQYSVAVGPDCSASGTRSVAIGFKAIASGSSNSIKIGEGTTSGQSAIGIGGRTVSSATKSIAIGFDSDATGSNAIAIGTRAEATGAITSISIGSETRSSHTSSIAMQTGLTTANNQLVIGSADFSIVDVYIGSGVQGVRYSDGGATNRNGTDVTYHASGAHGTNFDGGNITIAGGKGTGTGTPGDVIFSTADAGASGSTLQTLAQRVWVKGETGQLSVGTASPNASALVQVESTTQGFLPPRMTTAQRDAIGSPAAGLVIFNTTTTKLECYDGSTWQAAW